MLCDISEPMLGRLFLQIWNACCSSKPKGTTDTEWELLSVSILRCYLDESDWQAYGLPEFTESDRRNVMSAGSRTIDVIVLYTHTVEEGTPVRTLSVG